MASVEPVGDGCHAVARPARHGRTFSPHLPTRGQKVPAVHTDSPPPPGPTAKSLSLTAPRSGTDVAPAEGPRRDPGPRPDASPQRQRESWHVPEAGRE